MFNFDNSNETNKSVAIDENIDNPIYIDGFSNNLFNNIIGGVRKIKYPPIDSKTFNKDITNILKPYKIKKDKKTLNDICFPKKFQLQKPQESIANYINPNTPYKSILLFHKIGSGKTCSAINIAEQWKGIRKIIFVAPASLLDNFRKELRSQCPGDEYISTTDRKLLEKLHPTSKEYEEIIKKTNKKINNFYQILSYNKFIEKLKNNSISFNNKVLIIDEIQNLISESGTWYKIVYNAIKHSPSDLRIVLLSGTPIFDKPSEISLTLNLLRPKEELPIGTKFNEDYINITEKKNEFYYDIKNIDEFKKKIKGYISYYRGAPPVAYPKKILKYVKCEMSEYQFKSYLTVSSKEGPFRSGDILKMSNNFFIGSRTLSNIAFPNKGTGDNGYESLKGDMMEVENLEEYSIKFSKILKKVKRCSGTAFIYSNFKEYAGIKTFCKILEYNGFKNYINEGEGKKRYAIWSGDEKTDIKEQIRNVFNNKKNFDGSKIKIILGSPAIKEGVSLLRVKQVHVIEPYWNMSRLEQVIGRAFRFCSHKDVPKEHRFVQVYIYIATYQNEITIDKYILELAKKKEKLMRQFELAMKESAVDCSINYFGNIDRNEKYICQK
jgi:superfamily II DNA or RNA helicase